MSAALKLSNDIFFRFQVHVFEQSLHLLAGECALCQIMYSLAGLFWRNDLGCASVIPSEQTASSYIILYKVGRRACRSVDTSCTVPRSADYEYEYVWVSRILTRWLSVPRRRYWQNEYEYEYNVVGRVKLAAQ